MPIPGATGNVRLAERLQPRLSEHRLVASSSHPALRTSLFSRRIGSLHIYAHLRSRALPPHRSSAVCTAEQSDCAQWQRRMADMDNCRKSWDLRSMRMCGIYKLWTRYVAFAYSFSWTLLAFHYFAVPSQSPHLPFNTPSSRLPSRLFRLLLFCSPAPDLSQFPVFPIFLNHYRDRP
jgi:hypothetical protein